MLPRPEQRGTLADLRARARRRAARRGRRRARDVAGSPLEGDRPRPAPRRRRPPAARASLAALAARRAGRRAALAWLGAGAAVAVAPAAGAAAAALAVPLLAAAGLDRRCAVRSLAASRRGGAGPRWSLGRRGAVPTRACCAARAGAVVGARAGAPLLGLGRPGRGVARARRRRPARPWHRAALGRAGRWWLRARRGRRRRPPRARGRRRAAAALRRRRTSSAAVDERRRCSSPALWALAARGPARARARPRLRARPRRRDAVGRGAGLRDAGRRRPVLAAETRGLWPARSSPAASRSPSPRHGARRTARSPRSITAFRRDLGLDARAVGHVPRLMSVLRNLEEKIAGLVEGTFGRVFRTAGAPGRDRAQAGARDGRAQDRLGLAHLRAQRVRRLAVARGPRALRGRRARGHRRAVRLPARARPARAARARQPPADRVPHRRAPAPRRVRHPGAARRAPAAEAAPSRPTTATRWSTRPPAARQEELPRGARSARAARAMLRRRGQAPADRARRRASSGAAASATSCCDDSNVSRRHAEIRPLAATSWTSPTSARPTASQVNGRAIGRRTPLQAGRPRSWSAPSTSRFEVERCTPHGCSSRSPSA